MPGIQPGGSATSVVAVAPVLPSRASTLGLFFAILGANSLTPCPGQETLMTWHFQEYIS